MNAPPQRHLETISSRLRNRVQKWQGRAASNEPVAFGDDAGRPAPLSVVKDEQDPFQGRNHL